MAQRPTERRAPRLPVAERLRGRRTGRGLWRCNIAVSLIGQARKLVVERWTDNPSPPDLPRLGDKCCIPVILQHFNTKNGTGTRLCWGDTERGEAF